MKQILIIIILLVSIVVNAQLNKKYFKILNSKRVESTDLVQWRQVGPGMSGYCEEFWCHPTDKNVIMMSPDMYNTYGTWDAGKTWHTIKDCDGDGKDLPRIRKFTFSHQNNALGMAISGGGRLYKTENTGHSWEELETLKGKFAELTVDPTNDKIWYAGPGDFWNVKANHRHQNGQTATTKNDGIYKSTDQGKTWVKIKIGAYADLDVGRIIVDPTNSKIVLAATNKGMFRSVDGGKNWESSGKGLPVNRPRDMDSYFDKKNNEFIIFVVDQTSFEANGQTINVKGGTFKSLDHGASWENITGNLAIDLNKITSGAIRQKYWSALAFWFQTDVASVKKKYPELPVNIYTFFHRIQVNPINKNEIYLSQNNKHDKAFLPGGAWKSEDGGKTWKIVAREGKYWINGADNAYWKSRNNPTEINTQFAHLQPEMDHREESWGNRFLEVSANGTVYICLDQQVLSSEDGGKSWKQIDDNETEPGSKNWVGRGGSNLPGRVMLLETGIKERYLFCSGEHGLWQTAPLGNYPDKMAVAVKQIEGQNNEDGAHSIASVAVHPKDPNTIFFLAWRQEQRGKLRKSTDGGKTWENISTILESDNASYMGLVFQNSLMIDPVNPQNMYFCTTRNPISEVHGPNAEKLTKGGYGFYRSKDGGYNWELSNEGFHKGASIRRVIMDWENSETLYAAANDENGALYQSKDKGTTWNKMQIPTEIGSVNNVFMDRNTKYLFISCGNESATDKGAGVWRSKDLGISWEKIVDMPFVWQTETSPINPNIIVFNTALPPKAKGNATLNPGAYLSLDGGKTWNKINKNLGQQDRITELKPDPYRENVFWCAQKGSGWAIGYLKGTTKGWSKN